MNIPLLAGVQLKTLGGKPQFFDDKRVQQARQIGARANANSWPGLFYGAGASNAIPCLEYEHPLPCLRQVGGASEAIVPRPDDNHIPPPPA